MRWMQAQHAQGNFGQLTTLTLVLEDDDSEYRDELFFLFGAVLMLAGTWPLQDVAIAGAFDFDMALTLLPASIKHMRLFPIESVFPG